MYKFAFYGKGGIGKSTTVSNVSVALAEMGYKVMQIGCDPKADSTINLRQGKEKKAVLDLLRKKNQEVELNEIVSEGYKGVYLVEAGGPTPGLGCAGRGIIAAMELLMDKNAYEVYKPDVVLFDVLGDVVCGGFSMPIREGYADQVFILTSGEAMSIHAAKNIGLAIDTFQKRGYATLGGLIVNKRNVKKEEERIEQLCEDMNCSVLGTLEFDPIVQEADEMHQTVLEAFPESLAAKRYRKIAKDLIAQGENRDLPI